MTKKRFPVAPGLVAALADRARELWRAAVPRVAARFAGAAPTTPAAAASTQARLLASVQRATDEKTARIAMSLKITGVGSPPDDTATITGGGVIDLVRQQLTMSFRGQSNGDDVSLEVRVVGHTSYVKSGETWTSTPINATDAGTPDPNSYLDYLQGISGDVRVAGHETLRGDDTTRYAATVDLDRALARARNAAQRVRARHAVDLFGDVKMPATRLGRRPWSSAQAADLARSHFRLEASRHRCPGEHPPDDRAQRRALRLRCPRRRAAPTGAASAGTVAQYQATQSDLRNTLTAEKTFYTDSQTYTADAATLKEIEPALDWGGKLTVVVGNSSVGTSDTVCLSERSASGTVFSLGDVSAGPRAGTYYGKVACPPLINENVVISLGSSW